MIVVFWVVAFGLFVLALTSMTWDVFRGKNWHEKK